MAIDVPKAPDGHDFEDLIAAALRLLGYFTESRVVLKDGTKEILDLDVVATPMGESSKSSILFEAKQTEGYSFPILFKIFGQRTYLNYSHAVVVSAKQCDPKNLPVYEQKGREMGVRFVHYPIGQVPTNDLVERKNRITQEQHNLFLEVAWFVEIAKRTTQSQFEAYFRQPLPDSALKEVRSYLRKVQDSVFLPTAIRRTEALYEAYTSQSLHAAQIIKQMESGKPNFTIWNTVNDTHKLLWLQFLIFLETTSMVRVLKNALDVCLLGEKPKVAKLIFKNSEIEINMSFLSPRFLKALEEMKKNDFAGNIPFLFQVFSELFGGFLFMDDGDELQLLSQISGIPPERIIPCLKLFDSFFSNDGNSYFMENKHRMLIMKKIPGFMRGGGSFLRMSAFGLKNYKERYGTAGFLLGKWHNALYYTLEPKLSLKDKGQE